MASRLAQRKRPPGFIHLPPPPMPPLQLASRNGHAPSLSSQISHPQAQNGASAPGASSGGNNHIMAPLPPTGTGTSSGNCNGNNNNANIIVNYNHPAGVGSIPDGQLDATTPSNLDALSPPAQIPINTAPSSGPVAIPPPAQVVSPYYSPSQVFPPSSTNKSYFPTYLSQSSQTQRSVTATATGNSSSHRRSPLGTPLGEQQQLQPPKTPRSPSFFTAGIPTASSPRSPLASIERPASPFDSSSMPPPTGITSSSLSATPRTGTAARTYHKHLAQQQLAFQMQQRELIYQATRANTAMGPISPRLLPLGSPGPVTPLTLEDNPAGYLLMPSSGLLTTSQVLQLQQKHLEKLAAAAAAAETEAAAEQDAQPSQ